MRVENVVLLLVCGGALAVAGIVVVRWGGLERLPAESPRAPGGAALEAVRVLSVHLAAGLVAGFLVTGLGGRLVMRVLGATSGGGAQGRLTEADEVVGRITFGGSLAFVIFVGLGSGLLGGLVALALRRWLPRRAALSGLVVAAVMLGTVGVADPLSPDNVDFRILAPIWLAVLLILGLGGLFGATLGALAVRFDAGTDRLGDRRLGPAYAALVPTVLLPPLLAGEVAYVGLRAAGRGRLAPFLARPAVSRAGQVLLAAGVVWALWRGADATRTILTA